MDKKKGISMSDISRMAGVSVATVSRIANQNGRYSAETERKVRDIIEKYQYTPNMAAKGLRTKRMNFIGVIVPDITNDFFAQIVREVQEGLRERGYMAFVCNTGEDDDIERQYMAMLGAVNLAGLVFISGRTRAVDKPLNNLPAIYIDRTPENLNAENSLVIESDNYGGARMAVQELYEKGCRRIACMHSAKVISTHSFRYSGYCDQLAMYGLQPSEELHLRVPEVSFNAARECMADLLERGIPVDGLFCATDWLALGAIAALEQYGKRIPEDVRVVGFDDIAVASLTTKPLTTIHQQTDVLGRTAAEEILRLVDGATLKAQRIQIGVQLVRRQTT